ncbi:MAG: hypothetical protein AAB901_00815, partial [Patescibacteria group bacterium]
MKNRKAVDKREPRIISTATDFMSVYSSLRDDLFRGLSFDHYELRRLLGKSVRRAVDLLVSDGI